MPLCRTDGAASSLGGALFLDPTPEGRGPLSQPDGDGIGSRVVARFFVRRFLHNGDAWHNKMNEPST